MGFYRKIEEIPKELLYLLFTTWLQNFCPLQKHLETQDITLFKWYKCGENPKKGDFDFWTGGNTTEKVRLGPRMSGKILLKHDYEGNLLNVKQMYWIAR